MKICWEISSCSSILGTCKENVICTFEACSGAVHEKVCPSEKSLMIDLTVLTRYGVVGLTQLFLPSLL